MRTVAQKPELVLQGKPATPAVSVAKPAGDSILELQRTIGNRAVGELLRAGYVSPPRRNDERKADLERKMKVDAVAKTVCDVEVHPDDKHNLPSDFRTVGKGEPRIEWLRPDLAPKDSCMHEIVEAHENTHVENSKKNCADFKQCVDSATSFFTKRITWDDYNACDSKNHRGCAADCVKDESTAYEAGIKKAHDSLSIPKCLKEKELIRENIEYWQSIKDHAPNCK